jgi:hypothetical protein
MEGKGSGKGFNLEAKFLLRELILTTKYLNNIV